MDATDLAAAGDENLASTWALVGRSMGADVIDDGPLTLVATGLPLAFLNGAYVRGSTQEPERLVTEATRFFGQRNVPWLLWVRDGVAPAILAAGRAAGLRDAGSAPAMGLRSIEQSRPVPSELTIEIATNAASLRDHAATLRDGFGLPQEVVERLIQPALLDDSHVAAFVGRLEGKPVCCSLLVISATTAGVYNVATLESFRGRGYGEALSWAPILEGARRGCTRAVLQSSDAGYRVYRRMGFVDLGRYTRLEGPPAD